MWGDESVVKMNDRTCGGNTTNCSGLDIDAETSSTGLCPTYPSAVLAKIDAYDEAKGKVQILYLINIFVRYFLYLNLYMKLRGNGKFLMTVVGLRQRRTPPPQNPTIITTQSKNVPLFVVPQVILFSQ